MHGAELPRRSCFTSSRRVSYSNTRSWFINGRFYTGKLTFTSLTLRKIDTSFQTVEAGIVQLFVEAKRHQPAVVYIPSLLGWCAAVSETARTTVKAMLDSLPPNDPILLLAVVDGPLTSLPRDVRSWFGPRKGNQVALHAPGNKERREFFDELLIDVRKPPNEFPDGIKRRKRVLEELPLAPPLEPRQPTAAELALQEENDTRILTLLKYRLEPILQQLKRKFKRFTKSFRVSVF